MQVAIPSSIERAIRHITARPSWKRLFILLSAIAAPSVAIFLAKLHRHRKQWKEQRLPGPPHDVLFGHLRVFSEHAARFVGMHLDYTAESIATAYGTGIVFLDLWPFSLPMCLISDPEIADQVVRTDNLPKCLQAMTVHFPIFGNESLALAGSDTQGQERWQTIRRAIAPGFKKGHLERAWTEDIVEEGEGFVRRLRQRASDGQSAVMAEYLVDTTLDLILRVTISSRDARLSKRVLHVLNAQLDHASGSGIRLGLFSQFNPIVRYGEWRRTRQMYNLLSPSVIQHIEASKQPDFESKAKKDVLDWALSRHPDFSISTLVDQVKTFVLAGHDTASSTLAWTYYHLSQSPDVLEKLRQEHNVVFSGMNGKGSIGREGEMIMADPSRLNQLRYTLAVMREALRLYPPAAAVRKADSDVYVVQHHGAKYSVAGCMLWINHWCLHRSKAVWGEDAAEFKPERWLDGDGNMISTPLAWQPFSKGPKNCIGMEFGILEQKILLSMTIRMFDFEYVGKETPYQIFRLTAQPHNGIPLRISLAQKPSNLH